MERCSAFISTVMSSPIRQDGGQAQSARQGNTNKLLLRGNQIHCSAGGVYLVVAACRSCSTCHTYTNGCVPFATANNNRKAHINTKKSYSQWGAHITVQTTNPSWPNRPMGERYEHTNTLATTSYRQGVSFQKHNTTKQEPTSKKSPRHNNNKNRSYEAERERESKERRQATGTKTIPVAAPWKALSHLQQRERENLSERGTVIRPCPGWGERTSSACILFKIVLSK